MPPKKKAKSEESETVAQPVNSCADAVYGKLKVTFSKISEWKNGENHCSKVEDFHGTPWYLCAKKGSTGDHLQLYIYASQSLSNMWSITATTQFTLINRDLTKNHVDKIENDTFNNLTGNWGLPNLIKWSDLTGADKGFVDNDELKIEVDLTIYKIVGFRKVPSFDFTSSDPRHDLTLVIGGKKLFASRQFLSIHSPVLNAMLYGSFDESKKNEIELNDVEYDDFLEMMNVIYPSGKKITDDTATRLLAIGDYLQIKVLLDLVEKHLIDSTTMTNAAKLKIAGDYRLTQLQGHCLSSIKKGTEIKDLNKTEEYKSYSDSTKLALFERFMKLDS